VQSSFVNENQTPLLPTSEIKIIVLFKMAKIRQRDGEDDKNKKPRYSAQFFRIRLGGCIG